MKRRTAMQAITLMMASYFPQVPQVSSEEFKTLRGTCTNCGIFADSLIQNRQKPSFFLQLSDIKDIRVSWGESSITIDPQELWDALHRKEKDGDQG